MTELDELAPQYKEYTVEQVYKALAANGFDHLRGQWFSQHIDGTIHGGCVLAQAALNLGVSANTSDFSLAAMLNKFEVNKNSKWLKTPNVYSDRLGYSKLGDVIIYWNDLIDPKTRIGYYLKTYQDVAKMAWELMKPFFKETISLEVKDYKFIKVGEPVLA